MIEGAYTSSSWISFEESLELAQMTIDDLESTEKEVSDAQKALDTAHKQLIVEEKESINENDKIAEAGTPKTSASVLYYIFGSIVVLIALLITFLIIRRKRIK